MTEREPFSGTGRSNFGSSAGGSNSPGAADQAREKSENLAAQAQERASEAAEQVKNQAVSRLAGQKAAAADSLGSAAQAVKRTSNQLREQNQGALAEYAESAADQLESFSEYLRDSDVEDIVYEVERYARRQPAVFLGGALVLGFLGARFLKSGASRREYERGGYTGPVRGGYVQRRYPSPYGPGYGAGGYGGYSTGRTGSSSSYGEPSPRTMGEVPGNLTHGMGTGTSTPGTSGTGRGSTPGTSTGGITPGTVQPSPKPSEGNPGQGGTPSSGGSEGR